MNIIEQEKQLRFGLNSEIVISVIVWVVFVGYIIFGIWSSTRKTETPLSISNNVPTIKQSNIDNLRSSIKTITVSNLPAVRLEPFD